MSDKITKVTFSSYFLGPTQPKVEKTHLYRITKDWKVDEATWLIPKEGEKMWNPEEDTAGQGGTFTEEDAAETEYAEPENWEEYDVTEIIKYFFDNPEENYGFLLISDEELNNTQRGYISSDYKDDTSLGPKLTFEGISAITHFPQKGIKDKTNFKKSNSAISFVIPYNSHLVTISNAEGRKIESFRGNHKKSYEIPLSTMSNGVYFLNIRHNHRSETITFIVVR